ncbi:hypothetical protein Thein_1792 [Thermodesulfatator indicus DSM 15286]|uniref:FlgD Ig-like domain-containing protein n=1 Tax=Thermodesulfatator indicus (strain DSM 15286 / JCM 11887 / CIR29812) TaxID=667014 RepID=F8ABV6_THEID|nr:hypothetical protein [Thermodesulfatator indicus]AEH45648.1 hypothetical protein Thein_1792 [Thermodesulfatator indicus DSM 15286]
MKNFFLFIIIFILCLSVGNANSKIVILPFEDLSKDINGINFEIPTLIAQSLADNNITVITPKEVLPFLAENRIRWVGWLDRITAIKLARKYQASLIMVGTVTENNKNTSSSSLGITVQLIRPKDYSIVWAKTIVSSSKEEVSFLALKKVDYHIIKYEVIHNLIASLPIRVKKSIYEPPEVQISEAFISPRRIKGNEKVTCAVRLDISGPPPKEVYFFYQDRKIKAQRKDSLYIASWKAPKKEGRYFINMELYWPDLGLKKKIFLSDFRVDNTPPTLGLKLSKGKNINGKLAFNKYIYCIPKLKHPEPIARWLFEVIDKKSKKILFKEDRPGQLPKKFVWRGKDRQGYLLPSGLYVIRLKVWDLAGNIAQAQTEVLFVRNPPQINLLAEKRSDDKILLKLNFSKHLLPIDYIRLEIWDDEGNLLKEVNINGEDLEKKKNILFQVKKSKSIFYSLEARDIIGNKKIIKNFPLSTVLIQAKKENKKKEKENIWIEDF